MVRFGDFELDETARSLLLRGRPVELQPKVFDLLGYLVRNAGRVVPKDELMDRLWGDVHVTEASLQRAVSLLRSALREGGMDGALKSFVRNGYRFAFDRPDLSAFIASPAPSSTASPLDDARRAATARDWHKAAAIFAAHEPDGKLGAEDYELWAFAIECEGQPFNADAALRTAIERYAADKNPLKAGRCAVTLAKIHLEQGKAAVARGWLARAAALLKEDSSHETRGYLLWMQARLASFEGQPEDALSIAREALAEAEASGSLRLQALTLVYVGFFNISLGNTKEGLEKQDHAAAMALSSQVDPITGSLIYCNILWSCRSSADWARASQWSVGFEEWCEANFAKISPSCNLHRAEVMGVKNTLAEALAGVHAAIAGLPKTDPWALGDAYRVRGDIRAALGDVAAAKEDYALAYEVGWDAEPGNAMLLHEAGDSDGAIAALDRVLASPSWFSLQRRGWILANKALICARSGREEDARACLKRLQDNYDAWPSPAVRALAAEAQASLPTKKGADEPSPVQLLNLARQLWTSLGAEYHAARVRLDLVARLAASSDVAGALVEARCALVGSERIGARALQKASAALVKKLEA